MITGTSTGIGHGVVHEFIRKGYFVFGNVRTSKDAFRLQAEFGNNFKPLIFDITNEAAVYRNAALVKEIIREEGLSGLINNAGIAVSGPLLFQPIQELRNQFAVNVIGQIIVIKAFAPLLGAGNNCPFPPGKIIFISSSSGKLAHLFLGAYTGSKHAIEGMARVLRMEMMLYGIDVFIIGPGAVNSAIWDKASAQEVAEVYKNTDYATPIKRFQKYFISSGKSGYEINTVGRKIVAIFEKKHHSLRYVVVKNRIKKWIIPRVLPSKFFDKMVAKKFGIGKE